jgi:hypothetical protein
MKLTHEQAAYLGDEIDAPAEIISCCLALLKARGYTATATWTDPKLTSTSERHCLQIAIGDAHYYGYGETQALAARSCFAHLWFSFVTVPDAPEPSEDEILMRDSGEPLGALELYMNRTGETLRIARHRLKT